VTNTLDDGPGSLRSAIVQANTSPGPDRIAFAIPTTDANFRDPNQNGRLDPGDSWSIGPMAALPAVTEALVVDGWSQGGPAYRGNPIIALNGLNAGSGSDGLTLAGHFDSTIRGVAIKRFGGNGVAIRGGGRHTLLGNFIGADVTGQLDRGNTGAGVLIEESRTNVIGGARPGERNLISGNDFQGINISGAGSVGNRVVGNLIGTTISGDSALANGSEEVTGDGIRIDGGRFNVIGGRRRAERNVVSGNFDDGIDLHDGAMGNRVLGNYIGTDSTGTQPLGNGVDGIFLQDASHNFIGGAGPREGNVIGANGFNGVFLFGDSHDNSIAGNFIGTNRRLNQGLGNNTAASFADGVFLAQFDTPRGPRDNTIRGNTIAHNAGTGISIDIDASANSSGNRILRNAIFANGEQGIDLVSDGVTPNDPGDGDLGPNGLQNAPRLVEPIERFDGTFAVTGTLDSTPGASFRIEFFASSGSGEGEAFLGSMFVVADEEGNIKLPRLRYKPIAGKPYITATATNLTTGDTSEFSASVRAGGSGALGLDPEALSPAIGS
jgi:hypothetical protein